MVMLLHSSDSRGCAMLAPRPTASLERVEGAPAGKRGTVASGVGAAQRVGKQSLQRALQPDL